MRCAGANLILKKLWNTFQRLRPEEFSSEINEPQYFKNRQIGIRIRIRIRIRRVGLHSKSPAEENSSGRNLRRNLWTKTPQAEASGKCATTIFFAPPPPPLQIKLGGPIAVNCSGIKIIIIIIIIIIIMNFYSPMSNTRCHSIGHKMRIARIKIRGDSPRRWEGA